jgi:IS30 family transposase
VTIAPGGRISAPGRGCTGPNRSSSPARLAGQVTAWLREWWSPQEIAHRLRIEFADDPAVRVSHETIYQSLFLQGRGELRRELVRCLRTGRVRHRPRRRAQSTGRLRGMVMIGERPAEAEGRAVPGHWEGDLIIGRDLRSAVGTLVERTSRYVVLLHLPQGRDAAGVEWALRGAVDALPAELCRSLTWDQGKEMACHAAFTASTGVQVFCCEPHKPWQRGSNENTNGLLRQHMPKGTDLSVHSADDLARFARSLGNRPRKTLGYVTPYIPSGVGNRADFIRQVSAARIPSSSPGTRSSVSRAARRVGADPNLKTLRPRRAGGVVE